MTTKFQRLQQPTLCTRKFLQIFSMFTISFISYIIFVLIMPQYVIHLISYSTLFIDILIHYILLQVFFTIDFWSSCHATSEYMHIGQCNICIEQLHVLTFLILCGTTNLCLPTTFRCSYHFCTY